VDHADLERAPGVDGLPGEHEMSRVRRPDDLDELLPEHEGDDQADPRERHPEARHVRGYAQVTVKRQLAAAGDGVAVDHGDGGMLRALDTAEHLDDATLRISLGPAPLLHLLEVHAGAEGGSGATDDDHAHVTVGVQLLETMTQRGQQRAVHCVALAGAVESDSGHAVVDRAEDFISHKCFS
jgi:hypothetical protein